MDDLLALGLSQEEAGAYLDLLRGRAARPAQEAVWDAVVDLGLVRRGPEGIVAAHPRAALERWAMEREHQAAHAREAAAALTRLHDAATRELPFVEVLRGRAASGAVYSAMQTGAQQLVRAWDRGSYGGATQSGAPSVTTETLGRGVRYQVVYDGSTLSTGGMVRVLAESVAHGEEARIFPQLPMKMVITDDERGFIALPAGDNDVDSVLVHPSLLLDALVALFTMVWEMAVPAGAHGVDEDVDEASALEGHLLSTLSAGMTDAAIARALAVSPRTVARRVGNLQDRLGARSRFQLAALAAQRGWL